MARIKDLKEQRFGRLIAKEPIEERKNGSVVWKCDCDCGNVCFVRADQLKNGKTKSCSCLDSEKTAELGKEMWKKNDMANRTRYNGTKINALTKKLGTNNTSGIKGVYWDETRRKWVAHIQFKGEKYKLGRYDNKEDAIKARKLAEEKLFNPIIEEYEKEIANVKKD